MALKNASTSQIWDPITQNALDALRAIRQLKLVTLYEEAYAQIANNIEMASQEDFTMAITYQKGLDQLMNECHQIHCEVRTKDTLFGQTGRSTNRILAAKNCIQLLVC